MAYQRPLALTSFLLAGLLLSACGAAGQANTPGGQRPGGPPPAPVSVAKVQLGTIAAGITFTGDVTAAKQVNLAPKISGTILKLSASVGSQVKAGQQLAELDHSSLDAAVIQAQAAVEVAGAKLAQVQAQGRPEDVAKAQAVVAQQQAKLDSMQTGRPETVAQAQANLDAANAKLQALKNGSRPQDIANAQAALDAANAKLQALKNGPRPEQVTVYQRAIDVAKNNLLSAQVARDGACRSANSSCDAANATVNAVQTALDQANQQYQLNTAPPTATDLAQAEDAVKQAQAALDKLQNPNTPQDIAQAQAAVTAAQQALALAKNPSGRYDLAGQQAQVTQAVEAAKEAAQPYLPTDLQAAQANVDAAQAQLTAAKVSQAQAFVPAPFDGIVSAAYLSEGGLASPSTPIFSLVSTDVEVDLAVAQEQLGQLKVGQAAQLTTPAFGTKTFQGRIEAISPAADAKSRTFLVKVVPVVQDGSLKPGMSATVLIDTVQKDAVLLVPRDAVVLPATGGKPGVYVAQTDQTGAVAVFKSPAFGVSSGTSTEVINGLAAGDEIIVAGQASLINNQRIRIVNAGGPSASGAPARSGNASARPGAGASGSSQGAGGQRAGAATQGGGASASASNAPQASN